MTEYELKESVAQLKKHVDMLAAKNQKLEDRVNMLDFTQDPTVTKLLRFTPDEAHQFADILEEGLKLLGDSIPKHVRDRAILMIVHLRNRGFYP